MVFLLIKPLADPAVWRRMVRERDPTIEVRVWPDCGSPEEVDAVLAFRPPPGELARFPNLKLIVGAGAGVDGIFADPTRPQHVPVTRMIDSDMVAAMTQYLVMIVLRWFRQLPLYEAQQRQSTWLRHAQPVAPDCRIGLMGLGAMGLHAARCLESLGLEVGGWSRTPKAIAGIECYAGEAKMDAFLARSDILICLLPLTPATHGILGAATFRRLPRGARIINAARGEHLVEHDLLEALDQGQLAAAALDVSTTEPLPAQHPFWKRPDILITPHIATLPEVSKVADYAVENLRRLRAGSPLLGAVDTQSGY